MPYLKIQTNTDIDADTGKALMTKASRLTAEQLGKPERYVMVDLDAGRPMLFAGSDAPLAYLELKSIGLPETATAALSAALADLMHAELGVPRDRVYVEFADAARHMWGWNGATF